MSLRETSRKELSALGLHLIEAPASASAETWFLGEDDRFAAVIWRNVQSSNWQYRVYRRDERGIMIPVASDYGMPRYPASCQGQIATAPIDRRDRRRKTIDHPGFSAMLTAHPERLC
jgi:hypothetical protein